MSLVVYQRPSPLRVALWRIECVVRRNVRLHKVGGLWHWRIGRVGGSLYLARTAR